MRHRAAWAFVAGAAFSVCGPAHAGEKISLRCVGDGTETIHEMSPPYRNVKSTAVSIERYYELTATSMTERNGTLAFTKTKAEIEAKKENEGKNRETHFGTYSVSDDAINYLEDDMVDRDLMSDNPTILERSFGVNRRTAKWSLLEAYTGGTLDTMYGTHVTKRLEVDGTCEPWNPEKKF